MSTTRPLWSPRLLEGTRQVPPVCLMLDFVALSALPRSPIATASSYSMRTMGDRRNASSVNQGRSGSAAYSDTRVCQARGDQKAGNFCSTFCATLKLAIGLAIEPQ
jgi:hypothetical protein